MKPPLWMQWVQPASNGLNGALAWLLLRAIRAYQLVLSPFIGNQCRFHPTCSHYAAQAIVEHGPWRGSWLAVRRLLRCQPLSAGGLDPVPAAGDAHDH